MSHDGSSCKSYIKHPTEKERLDNLAFTSFPEDYLPYASSYHHQREGGKAPPYLVWEENRRFKRSGRRRRRGCCSTTALVSAIALIVAAILAVVAISVYLGVVTNLFRSPVLSLSGKFKVSEGDEFSDVLLNTTSNQFLAKADTYQNVVENVFLSSSLEPAFIAARVYAFRPGMLVFFRLYLDRRKMQLDDPKTQELVEDLMRTDSPAFGSLRIDRQSVQVSEKEEEWFSVPELGTMSARPKLTTLLTPAPSLTPATAIPDKREKSIHGLRRPTVATLPKAPKETAPIPEVTGTGTGQVIAVGPVSSEDDDLPFSYGQWKPVPIEDSVSPSFGDQRTPPGRGSVRLLDTESPQKQNPSGSNPLHVGVGSVKVLEDPMSHVDPIPIPIRNSRPIRPAAQDTPNVGEVASSIMSSVSLVVRQPNKNRTSNLPESGRLEMVMPTDTPKQSTKATIMDNPVDRSKDHASYRFLEEKIMDGDMDVTTEREQHSILDTSESMPSEYVTFTDAVPNRDKVFDLRVETKMPLNETSSTVTSVSSMSKEDSEDEKESMNVMDEKIGNFTWSTESNIETTLTEASLLGVSEKLDLKGVDAVNKTTSKDTGSTNEAVLKSSQSETGLKDSVDSSEIELKNLNLPKEIEIELHISENKGHNGSELFVHRSTTPKNDYFLSFTDKIPSIYEISPTETIWNVVGSNESLFSEAEEGFESSTIHGEEESEIGETTQSENAPTTTKPTTQNLWLMKEKITALDNFLSNSTIFPTDIISLEDEMVSSSEVESIHTTIMNNSQEFTQTQNYITEGPSETVKNTSETMKNNFQFHTSEGHGFHKPMKLKSNSSAEQLSLEKTTELTQMQSMTETNISLITDISLGKSSTTTSVPSSTSDMSTDVNPEVQSVILFTTTIQSPEETTFTTSTTDSQEFSENEFEKASNTTTETENNLESTHSQPSSVEDSSATPVPETKSSDITTTTIGKGGTVFDQEGEFSEISSEASTESSKESTHILAGVPKIVPQFPDIRFNPNDIEEDTSGLVQPLDDDLFHKNEESEVGSWGHFPEIIRHITTVAPTTTFSVEGLEESFVSKNCSEDQLRCLSGECVPLSSRCNMRRDCLDNSDEKNCTCADLLKVMGQSQKICDGIEDCRDHSDEQSCPWCTADQFICPESKFCVNRSQVCDGHNDCPLGSDERHCVKLAKSVSDAESLHYRAEGYLMVRKSGRWGKLCLDSLRDSDALRWKIDELGKAVCNALTYRNVTESSRIQDTKSTDEFFYEISSETPRYTERTSAIFEPSTCPGKDVVQVQCDSLECGLRPLSPTGRRRIVGGQSAVSGSWPWQAALYKEGDFQCGAVLLSSTWLVSAAHCFYSAQSAHWTARLGLLRRGSELPSPSEEVRRVERILLHPDYVDKGFLNDIALLRLEHPVTFSDYLRPICLPLETEDASLWHGRQCSVVGWGKLYEIGHTFPDSLQEVRLPVLSTEECRRRIVFLTMYHITDNMFCAGFERGGRDACLGDSGGPLMCQRDDGRWLLLGITSNGDGCGRPGRPGVYTKVTQYLSWIQNTTRALIPTDLEKRTHVYEDPCEGIRCKLGRCIPYYKLCDGRWDCSEGLDEDNCTS